MKAFHPTGRENMAAPVYPSGHVALLLCGGEADAVEVTRSLVEDLGFEALAVGLEPLALLWIRMAITEGYWRSFALGVLKR